MQDTVGRASGRITVDALVRSVCDRCQASRRQVRIALKDLVSAGELAYTYELGASFVVPSMNRPVRVSPRLILCPDTRRHLPTAGEQVVYLAAGAAFGYGSHPTTRLALAGLDGAMAERGAAGSVKERLSVLDVGTGSGVLIIAAMLLGAGRGLGTDIDPCAVAEARANVAANGLAGCIQIEDRNLDTISGPFDIVLANLRLPTLVALASDFVRCTAAACDMVVSGLRSEEVPVLVRNYEAAGFFCCWQEHDAGWAGLRFRKVKRAEE